MQNRYKVKCSFPMIGNRVYGPLISFEIEVNPIPHGGSGRNVPPYQEIVCLYVFFILDPVIYCSAWLRLKLNTKITLDTYKLWIFTI